MREWREDVRQIFTNCRIFNEDDSEIGKAGHELRKYFEATWASTSQVHSPSTEMPAGEESLATAPSSPEIHESPNSSSMRPASEMDDNLSIPPAETSEIPPGDDKEVEAPLKLIPETQMTSNEEEVERKAESPCPTEAVIESVPI